MLADSGPVAVLQAWVADHPRYVYIVDATERTVDGELAPATLQIGVDAAKNTEDVHVVRGPGAGSDIHASGDGMVTVRGPGIAHVIALRMNVRDGRILSPRHNDIRTGDFARVAQCFAAAAADVHEEKTENRIVLTLDDRHGAACGPEYGEAGITSDRVTLDAAGGGPLERERLAGTTVVERWLIHDLHVPPG